MKAKVNRLKFKPALSKAGAELLGIAMRGAAEQLPGTGQLPPVLLTVSDSGEYDVKAINGLTDQTKQSVARFINRRRKGIKATAFVTEAWVNYVDKVKQPTIYKAMVAHDPDAVTIAPRDDPERGEVVLIQLRQDDGQLVVVTATIQPDRSLSAWEVRVE